MSNNNAKEIEKLVQATVTQTLARQTTTLQKPAEPLPVRDAVSGRIIKVPEKLQPGQKEEQTEGSIKSPLTQTGEMELYDPALHVDSTGILTFIYKPIKSVTFLTASATPQEMKFIFSDVPRAP